MKKIKCSLSIIKPSQKLLQNFQKKLYVNGIKNIRFGVNKQLKKWKRSSKKNFN